MKQDATAVAWVLRLAGTIAVLSANIIGLSPRLFWEKEFVGVGVAMFVLGMLIGAGVILLIPRVEITKGAITIAAVGVSAFAIVMVVLYWAFLGLVDKPVAQVTYAWSSRQLLEFTVFGVIYLLWGVILELAVTATRLLRGEKAE